ncbi:signal recognition particle-docking protein FtsY [Yersinia kristensenii]|uniref:Signal recognition particle receptor FtsY n=1 Tax=Yersinia kristensenii TaxID=28152 RepID=A0A0T9M146_YERKR|nr:signal recognition particle-docking protein FtsY [Yersinia kristensenii]MDA5524188.1 signal recognition particle-docking protein FtsY [Yersinia kristensenii]MDR4896226.1 signal recognition particle-docking protein FtsY [Yersinia kristensenii]MDX6736883.1 signal recognition particle-docking protein FtsY [Yersinia kristensenii]PHZ34744.1 signal recognition particle-docking protein FtsY [Yersinia kristensenii]QKJ14712.1 signal recognition particle-docking protein FtsY [Yersinia kristensenii]
MAKEKKRGFFSWLGLGRQNEEHTAEPLATEKENTAELAIEEQAIGEKQAEIVSENTSDAAALPEQVTPGEWDSAAIGEAAAETLPEVAVEPTAQAVEENIDFAADPQYLQHHFSQSDSDKAHVESWDEGTVSAPELPLTESNIAVDIPEPQGIVDEPPVEVIEELVSLEDEIVAEELIENEEEIVAATAQEQERPTKEGFFARLKRSLIKTKQNLGSGFMGLFRGKKIDDDLFEELEEQLLIADVGVETTRKIITSLTEHASRKQLKDAEALYGKLKEEMSEILSKVDKPLDVSGKNPFVILMVGVNGVGKTTTIGKLARQFQAEGKSVMLAAGDTFRAAAVEQLQVWGDRNKIAVVAQHTGADSASVIFDAIQAAKARGIDVLLADTAGRLQNKSHLMEELKKIVRVMKKLDGDAPHEVMLTLDASTGQNAVSQAKLFNEAVGLTGITLTKLDGTAKGGVIFAIADQFGIPIRYIGVGEGIEDLRPFKADDFIEALFARED